MDHAALTYLKRTPEPIGQQGSWLDFIEEFNYKIEHRPVEFTAIPMRCLADLVNRTGLSPVHKC